MMIISGLSGLALSMFVFYFSDSITVFYLSTCYWWRRGGVISPRDFCLCC